MPNWQTQRGDRRPVDAVDRDVFDEPRLRNLARLFGRDRVSRRRRSAEAPKNACLKSCFQSLPYDRRGIEPGQKIDGCFTS
jgi:hypothetical protein